MLAIVQTAIVHVITFNTSELSLPDQNNKTSGARNIDRIYEWLRCLQKITPIPWTWKTGEHYVIFYQASVGFHTSLPGQTRVEISAPICKVVFG